MSIINLIKKILNWIKGDDDGDGTGCINYTGLKLVRKRKDCIGFGMHRSGWPWVFDFLETLRDPNGILFDDFIEKNFCYKHQTEVRKEPWVGVFHHPPSIPYFGNQREDLLGVINGKPFKESKKNLKLAFAMTEHLGDFLKKHLDCPVVVLKHPANIDMEPWSICDYRNNPNKSLIQVGYYLRNTQLIRHIPDCFFKKIRLWNNKKWINIHDQRLQHYWSGKRRVYNNYGQTNFLPASKYDKMLRQNIVVTEVFDASASNGVLDCITRNTPIIINKHPAVVEYLGEDYPLYFSDPKDIPEIAKRAEEAHVYLANMDKDWLDGGYFIKNIMKEINEKVCNTMR